MVKLSKPGIASLLILALLAVGCGSEEPAEVNLQPKPGDTVNGAKIVSSPPDSIPSGGVMLRPKNPNDPKFKPDPRLHGGG